jgi:hypothetical protein
MKKSFQILILAVLYLLLTAKSCDNGEEWTRKREQENAEHVRDSIAKVFRSDSLDASALRAYELTASQKLRDLADYTRVIGDSASPKEFREKAEGMAKGLLRPGEKLPVNLRANRPDSIWISRPLERQSDTLYSGELGFSTKDASGKEKAKRHFSSARISVLKQQKIFGADTVYAWKVLLGDFHCRE